MTGLSLTAIAGLALGACGTESSGSEATGSEADAVEPGDVVGGVDLSRHDVPLEDIHFDTFDGNSVPLSEADEATIERLRDAIPPLTDPPYEPVEGGDWLTARNLVLGFVDGDGIPRAYPHKILNFHEIVNDTFAGVPSRSTFWFAYVASFPDAEVYADQAD